MERWCGEPRPYAEEETRSNAIEPMGYCQPWGTRSHHEKQKGHEEASRSNAAASSEIWQGTRTKLSAHAAVFVPRNAVVMDA